jgi:hypothetical protein
MTTVLVRETIRAVTGLGMDPASLHWFDANRVRYRQDIERTGSDSHQPATFPALHGLLGRQFEPAHWHENACVGGGRRPRCRRGGDSVALATGSLPVQMVPLVYVVKDGLIHYGPHGGSEKMWRGRRADDSGVYVSVVIVALTSR